MMTRAALSKDRQENYDETDARSRILDAAFAAFMKNGYASTSTLEIATRARVSKRELYTLVGNKQALASFGMHLLREITDPTVITVFRLAIAEAVRAPEVAQALDSVERETSRAACARSWSRPRRPDCWMAAPTNLPSSSAACYGVICRSACCSASPGGRAHAKSPRGPATRRLRFCNFIRFHDLESQ
jgi:AcrR family transcriptional regulator